VKKKTEEARDLTPDDQAHIESLSARFGGALSREQVESNFRMSLGMPDATGRKPAAREVLGALKLFSDLLLPRPKASEDQGERPQVLVVSCPYCSKSCACGAAPKSEG